ncbi:MAG: ABC transporter substrate-binding protein [Candidatus Nanohaloarchaea archaeon]
MNVYTSRKLVFAVIFLVVISSAGIYYFSNPGSAGEAEKTVFVKGVAAPLYPPIWAIEQGKVKVPEGIEFQKVSGIAKSVQMAASGKSDTGSASLLRIGYIKEKNPDLKLVGYGLNANSTYFTIYSRSGSGIDSVEDLDGKAVGLPLSTSIGVVGEMALKDAGADNITVINKPFSAMKPLLVSGDVAAAMIPGTHPGLQVVIQPKRYWEHKYDADLPTGLWYSDGQEHVEEAKRAAELYNRSIRVSFNNISKVSQDYKDKTGSNLSKVFRSMKGIYVNELDEEDWKALQSVVDYAYRNGYIKRDFNLSSLRIGS